MLQYVCFFTVSTLQQGSTARNAHGNNNSSRVTAARTVVDHFGPKTARGTTSLSWRFDLSTAVETACGMVWDGKVPILPRPLALSSFALRSRWVPIPLDWDGKVPILPHRRPASSSAPLPRKPLRKGTHSRSVGEWSAAHICDKPRRGQRCSSGSAHSYIYDLAYSPSPAWPRCSIS